MVGCEVLAAEGPVLHRLALAFAEFPVGYEAVVNLIVVQFVEMVRFVDFIDAEHPARTNLSILFIPINFPLAKVTNRAEIPTESIPQISAPTD